MYKLDRDELIGIGRLVAGDGEFLVTWDSNQALSIATAIEDWFEGKIEELFSEIEAVAPYATNLDAKNSFVKCYMQVKALGLPKKHLIHDYYDNSRKVMIELQEQTDRGVAIIGAALLDASLEQAINVYIINGLTNSERKLLIGGTSSALNELSSKAILAFAFGLIGKKSYDDLKLIASIRNKIAHKLEFSSFENHIIKDICSKLQLGDYMFASRVQAETPREKFINSVTCIMHFIYSEVVAGTEIGHEPKKSP